MDYFVKPMIYVSADTTFNLYYFKVNRKVKWEKGYLMLIIQDLWKNNIPILAVYIFTFALIFHIKPFNLGPSTAFSTISSANLKILLLLFLSPLVFHQAHFLCTHLGKHQDSLFLFHGLMFSTSALAFSHWILIHSTQLPLFPQQISFPLRAFARENNDKLTWRWQLFDELWKRDKLWYKMTLKNESCCQRSGGAPGWTKPLSRRKTTSPLKLKV